MSAKYFCDICEEELTDANMPKGDIGRVDGQIARGPNVLKVVVIAALNGSSNSGNFCKYCIIRAVNTQDDRPRQA